MDKYGPRVLLSQVEYLQKGEILDMLPFIYQAIAMQHPELGPRGAQEGEV